MYQEERMNAKSGFCNISETASTSDKDSKNIDICDRTSVVFQSRILRQNALASTKDFRNEGSSAPTLPLYRKRQMLRRMCRSTRRTLMSEWATDPRGQVRTSHIIVNLQRSRSNGNHFRQATARYVEEDLPEEYFDNFKDLITKPQLIDGIAEANILHLYTPQMLFV
ncbi:hypothetical protein RvY_18584 [Ramazzottius varieornatus]|uniref:Uncharacterized protein n=1 Tax=Ramazzottius varieornatus TaxID=947166 RepID=A0A1D1W6B7_RAMVA|nr:hypothetical protein RvY_18584 [Ramazzottius varieornatus]